MGVSDDCGCSFAQVLTPASLVLLDVGDILLYVNGLGKHLLAAKVKVVSVDLDANTCKVKIIEIVKKDKKNPAKVGDIIMAIPLDLSNL